MADYICKFFLLILKTFSDLMDISVTHLSWLIEI